MKLSAIVPATLIATAVFFSTFSLSAQTQAAPAPRPKMSREQQQQKHTDQMARELNLSPEQKKKFAQTDKTYDEREHAARSAGKEDVDKLRQERIQAHKALLSREQSAKYDQMLAKKKAKRDAHAQKKGAKMKHGKAKKTGQNKAPASNNASDKFHKD